MDHVPVRHREQANAGLSARYAPSTTLPLWLLGRIVRRHRLLIAACTAALVGATAYFTVRATPQYEASASIRIEEEEPSLEHLRVSRSPTPSELPTEIEVLRSRALAEAIVDSLGLQVELEAPVNVSRQTVFSVIRPSRDAFPGKYRLELRRDGHFSLRDRSSGASLGVIVPGARTEGQGLDLRLAPAATQYRFIDFRVSSFDDAVEALQRALRMRRRTREANIMDVIYKGRDPQLVREVPNALATRFIVGLQGERHAKARSTAKFLREQIEKLSAQLKGAEDSLRTFRERNGVVSLADEASSGVTRAAELQAKRDALETERGALAKLLQAIQDLSAMDSTGGVPGYLNLLAFPTLLHDQATAALLTSIATVEDRRSELLSRRSPQDPDVQTLTARANQLGDQIRTMGLTYLRGLANEVAALDAALARSRRRLDRIPEKELRFARLQREAKGLEEIVTRLQSQLKEAEIAEAVEDASVRLVDVAASPRRPVSPKPVLNLSLALLLGLVLGTSGALLRERMDRTVHSRHDMLFATGVPVLGLLPRAQGPAWWRTFLRLGSVGRTRERAIGQRIGSSGPSEQPGTTAHLIGGNAPVSLVEAYNRLDTNLVFAWPGETAKVLAVTSPLPGEGKTTVAANLAVTLAQRGARVLLMDADLRCGIVAPLFGIAQEPGLSDLLVEVLQFRKVAHSIPVSETRRLHVVSRGTPFGNPVPLLCSHQARSLLAALRAEYDSVIIDTPPVNVLADAAVVGAHSDGVIVVARAGVTDVQALAFAMDQLAHVRAPVVGAVLNDIDFRRDAAYDEGCRYYARSDDYALHGRWPEHRWVTSS